ncbi:MAG: hypothetical protein ACRDQX_12740, partial [Pseudonocardiaceae bacterium]
MTGSMTLLAYSVGEGLAPPLKPRRTHDVRHTGNQLTAASGATTRELMHRMGHGSMRAALIYQHATSARDRTIETALDALVTADRQTATHPDQPNQQRAGQSARDADPDSTSWHMNGTTHD